jgi:hypothetical protein
MRLTLSIDDEMVKRARELAKQRGTSLNQMIRDYLSTLAGEPSAEELIARLEQHWATSRGSSGSERWTREEIHDRSRFR